MKASKSIFILGIAVIMILGIMIIQYATPSRTVDFRGEVRGVAISEDGKVTLYATSLFSGDFILTIDGESRLQNSDGEEITAADLTKGAKIDINYRRYLFKDEKVHTVKTLKVW